ncbi:PREDICTED: exocyst complex component 7-like [Acropora digitifera]|uniref:exocyst complex component 7-like n=1 Tax=Acropora digitifera TaxID=70779 RepID=UPI00077A9C01|nr:PREDICTED: exocyst complex component 7-like [Acropora digitifera]
MDDISVRKRQLDNKLAQEKNILAFLKDGLEKTDQITGNMLEILSKIEVRIHKLEDTIVPVHRETDDLQRRQANIDKSLAGLDHVISYHHVYANVEHVIRDTPTDQLDTYIKNLERVLDAIEFFNQNNPSCMELSNLTSLRDYGRDSLEKEFRQMLNRHSKALPVETILALSESDEKQKEPMKFEHLSEKVLEDLCTITRWLNGPGKDDSIDFMSVYAQIRSNALARSLQGLKDSFYMKGKSTPGGMNTPARKGTAKRREVRRVPSKSEHGKHTANFLLELFCSFVATFFLSLWFSPFYLRKVFHFQSERELMKSIIPEQSQSSIFDKLIQAAMEIFISDGEAIINILKHHFNKHNYSAVQQVFPILKAFIAIQPDFYVTLQETYHRTQIQFPNLIHSMEATAAKALDDFSEGIKHGPDKHSNMPSDGTVHELTRNTLIFMEQLLPYVETVGSMLVTLQEDQSGNFFTREPELFTKVVADYVQRVLGALGLNLELKARVYETPTLSSLFLLNNYNYVIKALQRSGLLALLQEGGNAEVQKQYQTLIADHKSTYQKWTNFGLCQNTEMYRNLPFTKNPEKYIKYTVEEVEVKLKSFFDVSA